MIDLFVNSVQLNFKKIADYSGDKLLKFVSYLAVLVFGLSMIILFYNLSQIKLDEFIVLTDDLGIQLIDTELKGTTAVEQVNQQSSYTGITIEKDHLWIRNVGAFSYEILQEIKQYQSPTYLHIVLQENQGTLSNLIFITLYLKTIPFALIAILLVVIMSYIFKLTLKSSGINYSKSFEICTSLVTLPTIVYTVLKVIGLREATALFFFIIFYTILVFYSSRVLSKDE